VFFQEGMGPDQITQAVLACISGSIILDTPLSPFRAFRSLKSYVSIPYIILYVLLAVVWGGRVNEVVPEPYLVGFSHALVLISDNFAGRSLSYPSVTSIL